jgi:hypothetical protein
VRRGVIAKRRAKPAKFEEIALHVDRRQRGARRIEGQRRRLGGRKAGCHGRLLG